MSEHPCCACCEGIAKSDHVGHGGSIEKDQHDGPCGSCELEKRVGPIVADRTATLARELAEAQKRRDLAEQRASDHAKDVIRTRLQLAEARERLARVAKIRDTLSHCYEAGDSNAGCPAGAGFFDLIADELSAALHAPADTPQSGTGEHEHERREREQALRDLAPERYTAEDF